MVLFGGLQMWRVLERRRVVGPSQGEENGRQGALEWTGSRPLLPLRAVRSCGLTRRAVLVLSWILVLFFFWMGGQTVNSSRGTKHAVRCGGGRFFIAVAPSLCYQWKLPQRTRLGTHWSHPAQLSRVRGDDRTRWLCLCLPGHRVCVVLSDSVGY